MSFNPRSLTALLIFFMLAIETYIQISGLISGNVLLVRQDIFRQFGLYFGAPTYTYLTYAFIHGGLLHVGMNMYVTSQIGPPCEDLLGTSRFAVFTIASAIICGVFTYWILVNLRGSHNFVLIGFSGVIFAYIGYYVRTAMAKRKNKQEFLISFARRNVLLLAFVFVPLLFPQLGISGEAHLIGGVFGFLVAPLLPPQARAL